MNRQAEKIIVLGAGLSGLYTAHRLEELGYDVLVIEARERSGGRTFTVDGVDLGGSWISTKQPRIMKLCEHMGLKIYIQSLLCPCWLKHPPVFLFQSSK